MSSLILEAPSNSLSFGNVSFNFLKELYERDIDLILLEEFNVEKSFCNWFIDKLKLDDPVGAIAVHLICGIWGTLAVGIFGEMAGIDQFITQLIGVGIVGAFSVVTAFIILIIIKKTIGLRVDKEEEIKGLDLSEHGMDAYADFRLNQH